MKTNHVQIRIRKNIKDRFFEEKNWHAANIGQNLTISDFIEILLNVNFANRSKSSKRYHDRFEEARKRQCEKQNLVYTEQEFAEMILNNWIGQKNIEEI